MPESYGFSSEISVAVIIPVYKVEGTLEATVKSVQSQTYANLEIILVDDGSPDSSGTVCDVIAAQDPRIKVIHQKNSGVSAARNAGISAATSDYVCFVDSDDEISHDFIEKSLDAICKNAAQLAVCGVSYYYTDKTEYIGKTDAVADYSSLSYDDCMALFSDNIMALCVSKLFLRKTIIENNLAFKAGTTCGEDGLFMFEYLSCCDKVVFINISAYRYYYFRSNSGRRFFSLESQKDLFNAKREFLKKHCTEEDVKVYSAKKALGNLHNRFVYLAKSRAEYSEELKDAFNYYMPFIVPYFDSLRIFSEEDKVWLEDNKDAILDKNVRLIFKKAVNRRKKEKRKEYIKEFKKMSFKKKIRFVIGRITG